MTGAEPFADARLLAVSAPGVRRLVGRLKVEFGAAIQSGSLAGARRVVQNAVAGGVSGEAIYADVLSPALCDIGDLWEQNKISIADEHLATAITSRVMSIVGESLATGPPASKERVLITGVEGEQHVLGLRMVVDVLEGAGYDVLFLGAETPLSDLLGSVARHHPDLVALGATGPGSGERMVDAVIGLRGIAPALPIAVGGSQATLAAQVLGDDHVYVGEDATTVVAVVRSALERAGSPTP